MAYYLQISHRGFSNETLIVRSPSLRAVEVAAEIINNNPNAWARRIKSGPAVDTLCEDHVAQHRPEMLTDDGTSYLGGPALPL